MDSRLNSLSHRSWWTALTSAAVAILSVLLSSAFVADAQHGSESATSTGPPEDFPSYGVRIGEAPMGADDEGFDRLVDLFFWDYFQYYPTRATNAGIHLFDDRMRATSEEKIAARAGRLRGYSRQMRLMDPNQLGKERKFDRTMLISKLQGMALEYDEIQSWRRNPNYYLGLISYSINALLKRDYAPLDTRLVSLNGRLAEVPRVLSDAQENLDNPPAIFVDIALTQGKGLRTYVGELVPTLVSGATDETALADFEVKNQAAVKAIDEFLVWMEEDLRPRAKGDYVLGAALYQRKLIYEEMVETPLEELLDRGYDALKETQQAMMAAANEMEPGLSVQAALARMGESAPTSENLVPTTEAGLGKIRDFLSENSIITVPPEENLIIAETPTYRRALSFASMDSPGVLEKNANEAYYYVTPPSTDWPVERQKNHLSLFNPVQLQIISVHEAYPGHYYQFLAMRKCPSLVRQFFGARSNSEGWAHYCEQMMVDEGFGDEDPTYRLAQLNAALRRICRYIVGISIHSQGMSLEEGIEFFEEEGYSPRVIAEREAKRGTSDPTYLVYTLGKWLIMDLREEQKAALGEEFNLAEFHDQLLTYGRAPLPLISHAMAADNP